MKALSLIPSAPLPRPLAVGGGTALLVAGRCLEADLVSDPVLLIGESEFPMLGWGMPLPHTKTRGDYFWAIATIEALRDGEPRSEWVGVRARRRGRSVSGRLGRLELRAGLEPPPGLDERIAAAVELTSGRAGPLVAIALASYDPPPDLLRVQLDSIRAQTHERWICLISDDGSRPEALAELRRQTDGDPRFVLAAGAVNQGFYRNFERALSMVPAAADLVALCDQDDRWQPEKLERLAAAIEPGVTLAYSDMRILEPGGRVVSDTYWTYRRNNFTSFASVVLANTITGAAAVFDRRVLDHALPFPHAPGVPYHDHWIAQVAMALGEVRYVDRPLYDYVQHDEAALGHRRANAAGLMGEPLHRRARAAISRARRRGSNLGWRRFYFDLYCRVAIAARTLELRCGEQLEPAKRRALRRINDSPAGIEWLATRTMRPLLGRTETLARERKMLAGLAWRRVAIVRARLQRSRPRPRVAADSAPARPSSALTPILVDYFSRDGSTLMMSLLATSPQIAVEGTYPYERRYFNYLWRWASLLDERDWPPEEWSARAIASLERDTRSRIVGPPPWRPPAFLDAEPGDRALGRAAFDLVWAEFCERLAARSGKRNGPSPLRYIAEKHLNSWAVDLDALPEHRLVVLLRDPRDTWASIKSFAELRGQLPLGREHARSDREHLDQIVARQRERLRWISGLLRAGDVPVIRYEELVDDLPAVAARLSAWLDVDLDPRAAQDDSRHRARHMTSADPAASVGRWRRDLDPATAEHFTHSLQHELESLGFEV